MMELPIVAPAPVVTEHADGLGETSLITSASFGIFSTI